MTIRLKGLYTALITPFQQDGSVDEEGLRQLIRIQLKHGVNGLVFLGTTSESPTLTRHEKERIIKIGIEEVQGQVSVIIGTGSFSTAQTIEETLLAEKLGADAALVVVPYYNRPTQEGIYRHFKAITEAVSLPLCIYNVPTRTGQNILPETVKRIAEIPSIIGIKEVPIGQTSDLIEISRLHTNFSVLSGDDAMTLPMMALGSQGVISVVSNLVPFAMKTLVQACDTGDFKLAQALHFQLYSLFKGACLETNPIPIKRAMALCRLPAGPFRLPLCELSPANEEKLKQIVQEIPSGWL